MEFMKKQPAGVWATFVALVIAIVAMVIYLANIGSEGYFQHAAVSQATLFTVLAIVMLGAVLALAQVRLEGAGGLAAGLCSDAMRILVPVCFMAALMTLVSSRVEGFAFIYFSNPEVLQEVQTAANLSSAHGAIANIIALAAASLAGMAAAFFSLKKEG